MFVSLCHCGGSAVSPADTGVEVGPDAVVSDDGVRLDSPAPVDAPVDAPAMTDEGPCLIECPQPPPGCRYVGPVECRPGGCGALVCADAGGPAPVMCAGSSAVSFPTFDRRCAGDGDCFAAAHQTDCCGNVRVLGLNVSERAPFEAAERTCRGQYPDCGCPARPATDDDDQSSMAGEFGARCASGMCRSFAR